MTPKARATRAKIDKWDYIRLKTVLQKHNRVKGQPVVTESDKIFATICKSYI